MRPQLLIIFLISVSLNLYAGNSYQSDSSIYYFEKGVKAKGENKNILAITYFKKALSFDTSNAAILEELGNVALESNIYYTALDAYNKLVKIKKDNTQTLKQLAKIYFSLRRFKDALENAEKYEQLEPGADMNYIIGMCFYKLHQYNKALERLIKAEKQEPQNAVLKYTIGKIYNEDIQNYTKAIEYYEAALKLDSSQTFWEYEMGFVYYYGGRVPKAIAVWEKVEKTGWLQGADYENYFYNIGQAYVDVKNYPKAITTLKKSLEINPDAIVPIIVLGEAYYKSLMYKEAIQQFEKALKIEETNIDALKFLGTIYLKMGDKAKGQRYLNRAKELEEK
jgi:tetratricopeptide (TPR) repeat protein